MFKQYEVLEVYADQYGDVEDVDHVDTIQIDDESDDFYELITEELANIGITIPHTWDIIKNTDMGIVSIYDSKGIYKYQLRDF